MTDIKFRAWDKRLESFSSIYQSHNEEFNDVFLDPDKIFEQFSGFFARNHDEIWEGSLCVWLNSFIRKIGIDSKNPLLDGLITVQIIKEKGCFWVEPIQEKWKEDFGKQLLYKFVTEGNDILKVIGNIHENQKMARGG